jgi:pimeloyl-ACP methyl ester carboxylesterase
MPTELGCMKMAMFECDGLKLHYLVRGAGEPVVLIHGLGSCGGDWAFQVAALEGRFKTVVPDLPGSGHSTTAADGYCIRGFARSLWGLLDHLELLRPNLVGFSMGGAVALEMALQRPDCVPRLALINSLASYHVDDWHKWFEARLPALLMRLLGMRLTAKISAGRLFPEPWQRALRERAERVIAAVPMSSYLGMGYALQRWSATDRLHRLASRTLLIAAEYDYTPLAEKLALAQRMSAEIAVIRDSRHGTPFDSTQATNACLSAFLRDEPLPAIERRRRDPPEHEHLLELSGSVAEEHALVERGIRS